MAETTRGAPFQALRSSQVVTDECRESSPVLEQISCSVNQPLKRVVDLLVGIPLAVALTPLMVIVGIVSAGTFRSSPVFIQERLGKDGRRFRVMKIRSLPRHSPEYLPKNELGSLVDSRWGRFIRSTHIDELPQLWHVVSGKMSLIGPRPEMPNLAATFDQDFVRERLAVAPGCTGLWQISTAASGMIGDDTSLDLYYLRHWSVRLETWIALRTVALLFGKDPLSGVEWIPRWAR